VVPSSLQNWSIEATLGNEIGSASTIAVDIRKDGSFNAGIKNEGVCLKLLRLDHRILADVLS
jgi:hypothetical protein